MELSSIFSNGMVLQRNQKLTISGQASPSQMVHLSFLNNNFETIANSNGEWYIELKEQAAGGPYQMEITTDAEKIVLQDILVGDIWLLGGQSNMQLPLERTRDLFDEELNQINNTFIRQFSVPQVYNFHQPAEKVEGGNWVKATQESLSSISAVGYFFAKKIYDKYGVPIGLIQTAVGGTPIEAWMSEASLRKLGGYDATIDQCKDDSFIEETKLRDEKRQADWYKRLDAKDIGKKEKWHEEIFNPADWSQLEIPDSFKGTKLEQLRGAVWFTKNFHIPTGMNDEEVLLKLGTIVDADETFINGTLIGSTAYRYPPRRYMIPKGLLKPGRNTITVRVISTQSTIEFIKNMPYKLIWENLEIALDGVWHYKIGAEMEALTGSTFFIYKPAGMYNGMIAPLANYCIKGVLWYQGESNAHEPNGYRKLFEELVNDWRDTFNLFDLPFLFTQLPNFDTGVTNPDQSNWAKLREEQRLSLSIPNTAMAVTIDAGEHNDLHPQDKKTVGQRLALAALTKVYGEDLIFSGPIYREKQLFKDAIYLTFDHVGSGLVAQDGELRSFMICGRSNQFVPATAIIDGDKVIVKNDQVKEPIHVRYGWSDNPDDANLYNKEGLPASPFTTETSWD
ncbi:sialate O-acetylesterase [Aquibacillus salsiterrae]|uniref:Sialate O-acetylesterase n=1 Tax=Aquibacillus salsiterrae TaxID=2950439 RepID=A0A9X3WFY6_9BACI|nr:sialate O-acetylesterase [Aquibacillus salsiterrae]MDC3417615.1 sialate O-acetylesterase [Aquibacillus salsiterrae]